MAQGKKKVQTKKTVKKATKKVVSSTPASSSNGSSTLKIPANLLRPIGAFLRDQLSALEKRRSTIDSDDPFSSGRADSMASPDAGAAEQFGRARVEAMKTELDRRIIQLRKALTRVKVGSYGTCENCGNLIDTDRLVIYPEATLCIDCEKKSEKKR
jgi:RNA polymerase-binding transcription factor DksA